MRDDKKKPGFEVRDRRVGMESEEEKPAPETPVQEEKKQEKHEKPPAPAELPEITFPAFLLSLNTSALIHLGLIPVPGADNIEKNLPLAKQTIDLLSLIKEKTGGNLSQEEADLLDNLLFDLKMKYVDLSKEK
jgi:hypothetical protein